MARSQEGRLLLSFGHKVGAEGMEIENNFLWYHKRMWKGFGKKVQIRVMGWGNTGCSNIEIPGQLGERGCHKRNVGAWDGEGQYLASLEDNWLWSQQAFLGKTKTKPTTPPNQNFQPCSCSPPLSCILLYFPKSQLETFLHGRGDWDGYKTNLVPCSGLGMQITWAQAISPPYKRPAWCTAYSVSAPVFWSPTLISQARTSGKPLLQPCKGL